MPNKNSFMAARMRPAGSGPDMKWHCGKKCCGFERTCRPMSWWQNRSAVVSEGEYVFICYDMLIYQTTTNCHRRLHETEIQCLKPLFSVMQNQLSAPFVINYFPTVKLLQALFSSNIFGCNYTARFF